MEHTFCIPRSFSINVPDDLIHKAKEANPPVPEEAILEQIKKAAWVVIAQQLDWECLHLMSPEMAERARKQGRLVDD